MMARHSPYLSGIFQSAENPIDPHSERCCVTPTHPRPEQHNQIRLTNTGTMRTQCRAVYTPMFKGLLFMGQPLKVNQINKREKNCTQIRLIVTYVKRKYLAKLIHAQLARHC